MGSRWGPGGPPPEAYRAVTDPQRFQPLVDEVDRLVGDLERRYDVRVARAASWPVQEPRPLVRVVRLEPAEGAPLVLAVTDFPGVLAWSGAWSGDGVFPTCGCDACDETAEDQLERLAGFVASVVDGGFVEELSAQAWRVERSWPGGGTGGGQDLERARAEALAGLAPPGRHDWPRWPVRRAAGVGPTT